MLTDRQTNDHGQTHTSCFVGDNKARLVENRDLLNNPPLFDALLREHRRNFATIFFTQKLEWLGYQRAVTFGTERRGS